MDDIIRNIQRLQARLNEMVVQKSNLIEIHAISEELDTWIVQYYKQV